MLRHPYRTQFLRRVSGPETMVIRQNTPGEPVADGVSSADAI